jgi:mono/diheme cytochrome c family protein
MRAIQHWPWLLGLAAASTLVAAITAGGATPAQQKPDQATMDAGKKLYEKDCNVCHQSTGKGIPNAFPPLAGDANLADTALVVKTIRQGRSGPVQISGKTYNQTMTPVGAAYSAAQIASVATYVRNSWGNQFGPVTPEEAEKLLPKK